MPLADAEISPQRRNLRGINRLPLQVYPTVNKRARLGGRGFILLGRICDNGRRCNTSI